jgi:hypothetical protein
MAEISMPVPVTAQNLPDKGNPVKHRLLHVLRQINIGMLFQQIIQRCGSAFLESDADERQLSFVSFHSDYLLIFVTAGSGRLLSFLPPACPGSPHGGLWVTHPAAFLQF